MAKLKISEIKKEVDAHGWKLISSEYVNLDTNLEFECEQGHTFFLPYKKVRDKFICPLCEKVVKIPTSNDFSVKQKGDCFRILALDQATKLVGWSLFDNSELVKYGRIVLNENYSTIKRMSIFNEWLLQAIKAFKPDLVLLEEIQLQDFSYGAKTTKQYDNTGILTFKVLSELMGILTHTLFINQVNYSVVHSATWRAGVGVKGRYKVDKKRSAQLLVKNFYNIDVSEDEADAICLGKYGSMNKINKVKMVNWE